MKNKSTTGDNLQSSSKASKSKQITPAGGVLVEEEVSQPSSMVVDGEVERPKSNKKISIKKKVKSDHKDNEDVSKSEDISDTISKEDTMISIDVPPQNDISSSSGNKSKTIFSDKNFVDLPISDT